MKRLALYTVLGLFFITACKKKNNTVEPQVDPPPVVTDSTPFKCKELPEMPAPFGWKDTSAGPDKEIHTLMFNPANPNQIIFVVNGNILGYNKMYCYHVLTGQSTFLANIDDYGPSVNPKGWILYSGFDKNIYKIKCSGDSLTQLSFDSHSVYPRWDYSGSFYYYFQEAYNNVPNQIIRATDKGSSVSNLPAYMPYTAPFKKSHKIVYQKTSENSVTLYIHDMTNHGETALVTATYSARSTDFYFDNLCMDNTDENVYWSNSKGVFKCPLASPRTDTVFKNCPSVIYLNPVFQATNPNEIIFCTHLFKPLDSQVLLHQYLPASKNLGTGQYQLYTIFP